MRHLAYLLLLTLAVGACASQLTWTQPDTDTNDVTVILAGQNPSNLSVMTNVPISVTNLVFTAQANQKYFQAINSNTITGVVSDPSNLTSTKPNSPNNLKGQ